MSYQTGNIAYDQWQQPGREDYYYRGGGDNGNHDMSRNYNMEQNRTNQQTDFHRTGQQDTDSRRYQYREEGWTSGGGPHGGFEREHGNNREPSHRYPQTFQNDQNARPRHLSQERQQHGSESDNFNRNSSYHSGRDAYSSGSWQDDRRDFQPRQDHSTQLHKDSYRPDQHNTNQPKTPGYDYPERYNYGDGAPERYASPDRTYSPERYGHGQDDARHAPPIHGDHIEYRQGLQIGRNPPHSGHSQQNQDSRRFDGRSSYERERPTDHNEHSMSQHRDNYRNHPYNSTVPQSSGPPQIVAKTSGSNAVFGVVAKKDASPGQHHGHHPTEVPPTRTQHQPITSAEKDYLPSFDQYRGNDSHQQDLQRQQPHHASQHHYRNALTPISEKASPTSSNGSKGHLQDNTPMQQALRNKYEPIIHDRQQWSRQDDGFPNQRPSGSPDRRTYGQPQKPLQERPQTHTPRYGYRDFDASSGYASESTHNTEISYDSQRQFDSQNTYGSSFPLPPPELQRDNPPPPPDLRRDKPPLPHDLRRDNPPPNLQRDNPPLPHDPRRDNRHNSPNDVYTRSPSRNPEYQRSQYNYGQSTPAFPASQPDREENGHDIPHQSQESYGPPIHAQNRYDENRHQSRHNEQYDSSAFPREQVHQDPQRYFQRGRIPSDSQDRPYQPAQKKDVSRDSGVESSHVPGVQAARNMFEKRSDPRRPPPAPKPVLAPKPSNVNARPVPPRPAISSRTGYDDKDNRNQFQTGPYSGPKSPTSPQDFRRQPYLPNQQASHSQSMDNLNDRYFSPPPPSRGPPHTQSLQNLDERSKPMPEPNYPPTRESHHPSSNQPQFRHEDYSRNDHQQSSAQDDRPLVVAVKFNQDSGVSLHAAKDPPRRHGSWSKPRPGFEPTSQEHGYQERNQRQSWSTESNQNYSRQSYSDDKNWHNPPSHPHPTSSTEDRNYVPDVVARSYELASQSQIPEAENTPVNNTNVYSRHEPPPNERNFSYDDRPQLAQRYGNIPNQRSSDRWPTPPPPILQDQSRPILRHDNFEQIQPRSEAWHRENTQPAQTQQHTNQSYNFNHERQQPEANPPVYADDRNRPPTQLPLPPQQQQYQYDSDSSEIDVDAPTPPPSKGRKPATIYDVPRGSSPYDRNKPVPVNVKNQADSWRIVSEQPPNENKQRSANHQQSYPQQYPSGNDSRNPPLKPQRNSTSLSPQHALASSPETRNFDFDVSATKPLQNHSSREKMRLGKSGALANRKPPSRHGSASNLTEIGDEGNFQIEVTDSDLSSTNNKMEVHRMESMRILQTGKENKKDQSGDIAISVEVADKKQRPSQKSHSEAKVEPRKPDSKLIFKKPTGDAAKTIPMPTITEPSSQPTRRPPTYLGFGHTPEKPKTDLLSQFKSARQSAMRTAAQKQDKALKSVSALVKFNQGKGTKEEKRHPQPRLTAAERNAQVLNKLKVEVAAPPEDDEDDRTNNPYLRRDVTSNAARNSTRSSSTVKPEKYDGDDDTTNSSRHERERHGRGRDRQRGDDRAKSRGRSASRDRNLSPDRQRGRSSSRGRGVSPDRRRGRSTSRGRNLSPERRRAQSRHRSKSRERSLSPDERYRPRTNYDDRRYDNRQRRDDESSYRRSNSPDRPRYDDRRHERMQHHHHRPYHPDYERDRTAREPDWVEQFRRGREGGRSSGQTRRAWVNDPRRVEVTVGGRRRELDMDAFEREVKKATSYNSDFEQPPPPTRRQMIPSKLMAKGPPNSKRKPQGNWMNDLKEKNRMAAQARHGVYNPAPYRRRAEGDLKYYYKFVSL